MDMAGTHNRHTPRAATVAALAEEVGDRERPFSGASKTLWACLTMRSAPHHRDGAQAQIRLARLIWEFPPQFAMLQGSKRPHIQRRRGRVSPESRVLATLSGLRTSEKPPLGEVAGGDHPDVLRAAPPGRITWCVQHTLGGPTEVGIFPSCQPARRWPRRGVRGREDVGRL